jgi:hypothetical protein
MSFVLTSALLSGLCDVKDSFGAISSRSGQLSDIRLFHDTAAATARTRSAFELARSRPNHLLAAFGIDTDPALPQFHFHAGQPPSKFVVGAPGGLESHYRCSGHAASHAPMQFLTRLFGQRKLVSPLLYRFLKVTRGLWVQIRTNTCVLIGSTGELDGFILSPCPKAYSARSTAPAHKAGGFLLTLSGTPRMH